jgi:hypothetical protein
MNCCIANFDGWRVILRGSDYRLKQDACSGDVVRESWIVGIDDLQNQWKKDLPYRNHLPISGNGPKPQRRRGDRKYGEQATAGRVYWGDARAYLNLARDCRQMQRRGGHA